MSAHHARRAAQQRGASHQSRRPRRAAAPPVATTTRTRRGCALLLQQRAFCSPFLLLPPLFPSSCLAPLAPVVVLHLRLGFQEPEELPHYVRVLVLVPLHQKAQHITQSSSRDPCGGVRSALTALSLGWTLFIRETTLSAGRAECVRRQQ